MLMISFINRHCNSRWSWCFTNHHNHCCCHLYENVSILISILLYYIFCFYLLIYFYKIEEKNKFFSYSFYFTFINSYFLSAMWKKMHPLRVSFLIDRFIAPWVTICFYKKYAYISENRTKIFLNGSFMNVSWLSL